MDSLDHFYSTARFQYTPFDPTLERKVLPIIDFEI
jgi:hypothetical protein